MRDGEPLESGVIRAEDQRAEIGRAASPGAGLTPLTPNQAAALARDAWPDVEGAPGYTRHTVKVRDERELRRRDETRADEAWGRVDAAQETAKGRDAVASAYRGLASRAKRLIAAEEKLDAPREKAAEGARIRAEIDEARAAVAAARKRAGI